MRGRCLLLTTGLALVFALATDRSAFADVTGATELTVVVQGWVPGFGKPELPPFIANEMNEAGVADWRFVPAASDAQPAPNRIEWRFKPNPYAGGITLHRPGGEREIDQTFGVHRPISVEVRLYLNGEYQLLESAQPTLQGGARDRDLQQEIISLTRMLSNAANVGDASKS
jgi:hypothetical protein